MLKRVKKILILNVLFAQVIVICLIYYNIKMHSQCNQPSKSIKIYEDIIDFEGFDNINGLNRSIIPNIVHLLYLQQPYIKFYQLINIFTIYYNHRPDNIYIHCDNCSFAGKHFETLQNHKPIWDIIKFYRIPYKETIFGVKYGYFVLKMIF